MASARTTTTTVHRRHNATKAAKSKPAYTISGSSDSDASPSDSDHHSHDQLQSNGNGNGHSHSHSHGHSHGLFHSHSHDDHDHAGNQMIIDALAGKGTSTLGGRITLVGLASNVGLTISKGLAGWSLNSASLLADAAHSLSDLLGDFVTLFCWRLSRRPPSSTYPYGYAKFETMGTTMIGLLLIGGALGIGWHSYNLLMEAVAPSIASMSPGTAQDVLQALLPSQDTMNAVHAHGHSHGGVAEDTPAGALNVNAAWFALASILIKEYLFRLTRRVAQEERSPVLHANALHHRSDAYTSAVALVAILGNFALPGLPLDPLGGVFVSLIICWQSIGILWGALTELTDAGVSPSTARKLAKVLDGIVADAHAAGAGASTAKLAALADLRAVRSGSLMFVDVTARVRDDASVHEMMAIEDLVRERLKQRKKEVHEVRVRFRPVEA
ncbi:cation efflux protein [Auriculariales sp. MPI-PUGE-AT-0066]|nr:cation efflux protein [Auriculariales sp. MPI-PUGE-AT-0066]